MLLLCLVAGLAQAQSTGSDDSAPPDRVARLSYIAGDLGFLPAGSQDWAGADLNRPLITGDRLSAGDGARAELELGGASLRMDGDTDFGLLNLNDNLAQVELTQGTLNLSVRQLDQGQSYEIDTPTLALVISQPGTFRVDVDNDGNGTRVTVFNGQAEVYGENNAQRDVVAGRSYQFDDASLGALVITDIGGGDAFDAWCSERDQRYAQSAADPYVSADMVGYQDLDEYGSWQDSPDYGAVWYPSQVPVGWAPYRNGHWAWIAPWGWTWVDDLPWGFAPYHYGRWAYIRGAWGWIPGPRAVRPVYAPALVAFVGGGRGVSIGIGAPVGWFPLGPGEIYNPWYHCDRAYYQRVNIANIHVRNAAYRSVVINDINSRYGDYRAGRVPPNLRYANRTVPRGFTAVSGTTFAGGQRVQRGLLRVDPRQLAAAPVLARGASSLRPEPHGMAPPRSPQARPLPTAGFRRNVVARTPPPAALPAMHPNFAPANARTPQRTATPFANVRVLNARGAPPRPAAAAPAEAARAIPAQPRTMRTPNVPGGQSGLRQMEPAQAGALPSARFAHPQADGRTLPMVEPIRREQPAASRQAPRPGVSYIAGPQESHPQPSERPTNTLPQPPRFERAPAQEYVQPRQEPMREAAPPRPSYYQPQSPREYAQPAYQPQPRYEAPHPAQGQQRRVELEHNAPPPRRDDQH
ncbi:DUF6600 domain-containing protein [Rhodanobacter sp. Si-c]|uniref:DUF6600 domain-containing protein n=1 Tax=Rhodanobacter lycopersici TaxID=3162487 RepID=A0ABV3QI89_9GAMM